MAKVVPRPPLCWCFQITHRHTNTHTHTHSHLVGLRTSDRLVAEAGSYMTQNKPKRRKAKPSAEFETRDPRNRSPADQRLRPHGHWNRPINVIRMLRVRHAVGMGKITNGSFGLHIWSEGTSLNTYGEMETILHSILTNRMTQGRTGFVWLRIDSNEMCWAQ